MKHNDNMKLSIEQRKKLLSIKAGRFKSSSQTIDELKHQMASSRAKLLRTEEQIKADYKPVIIS